MGSRSARAQGKERLEKVGPVGDRGGDTGGVRDAVHAGRDIAGAGVPAGPAGRAPVPSLEPGVRQREHDPRQLHVRGRRRLAPDQLVRPAEWNGILRADPRRSQLVARRIRPLDHLQYTRERYRPPRGGAAAGDRHRDRRAGPERLRRHRVCGAVPPERPGPRIRARGLRAQRSSERAAGRERGRGPRVHERAGERDRRPGIL